MRLFRVQNLLKSRISPKCTNSAGVQTEFYVQVLPLIKSKENVNKILLCKWKSGNYAQRYTGMIGKLERNSNFSKNHQNLCKSMIPTEIRKNLVEKFEPKLKGILKFDGPPESLEYIYLVHLTEGSDQVPLCQTDEWTFKWFPVDQMPYDEMPADDRLWYPPVLSGQCVKGQFIFGGEKERTIKSYTLEQVQENDLNL